MTLLVLALLAFLMLQLAILIHTLTMAIVGRKIGATVEAISLGIGPAVYSRNIKGAKWSLRALPFGGFVKFEGMDESNPDGHDVGSEAAYSKLPVLGRIMISLLGDVVVILAGLLLISIPVMLESDQLTTDETGRQVSPVSVPYLGFADTPSSVQGQADLFYGTFVRFWDECCFMRNTDQWGGAFSWLYTTAVVTVTEQTGFLSCSGILYICLGLINLAPIPNSNGGHLVFLFFELIGRPVSEANVRTSAMYGLLITLAIFILSIKLDVVWLMG